MKPLLVTVAGSRANILRHQLSHYKNMTSGAYIVIYQHENSDQNFCEEIKKIANEFGAKIYAARTYRPFDWEQVTKLYNEVKSLYPSDWWIVSDDDELQVYWDEPQNIIRECDANGWQYVTGGFVDRIGLNGEFPKIEKDSDLWSLFPIAGFFRYPLSGACPNKTTLCKGSIEVTNGQHYVKINGSEIYGPMGWRHPWRYPINSNFVQVHHFKWDNTVFERIKSVADIDQNYAYSHEYEKMYQSIKNQDFKINISNPDFYCQHLESNDYFAYRYWKKLTNLILHV